MLNKIRFAAFFLFLFSVNIFAQKVYYPTAENWETRTPEQAKFDPAKLQEAIDFAKQSETKVPRDMELAQAQSFGREPIGEPVGVQKSRGEQTGIIIRNGYIVAEWGEPFRVDMTHSVTKSFLSTVVGIAFDRKMIRSLQDKAVDYSAPILSYNPIV